MGKMSDIDIELSDRAEAIAILARACAVPGICDPQQVLMCAMGFLAPKRVCDVCDARCDVDDGGKVIKDGGELWVCSDCSDYSDHFKR